MIFPYILYVSRNILTLPSVDFHCLFSYSSFTLDRKNDMLVTWVFGNVLFQVDFHIMEGEVEDMEKLATHLKGHAPEQALLLGEEVQATLQAWEEVGRSQAENRGRLSKFRHLQEFFEKYLAMMQVEPIYTHFSICIFTHENRKMEEGGLRVNKLSVRRQMF